MEQQTVVKCETRDWVWENQPWWMMPFSSRAWPRWTPSSWLPVSPISISQDTNSLGTHKRQHLHDSRLTHSLTHSGITTNMHKIPQCEIASLQKEESFEFTLDNLQTVKNVLAFAIITESLYNMLLTTFTLNWCDYGNKHHLGRTRNDLFTVKGHICCFKQPASFSLHVLSSSTLFILDKHHHTINYERGLIGS